MLRLHPIKFELKFPFRISRHVYSHTHSLVVELIHQNKSGFGEATFNPYYPNTSIEYMSDRLLAIESKMTPLIGCAPELFWDQISPYLIDCPFALNALDQAYHDWYTRQADLKLYEYWKLDLTQQPSYCYTLSIDTIDLMIERMKTHNWPAYKIKLGTGRDIEIVEQLRQHTSAPFWVDVNGAWSLEEAIEKSKMLKRLGVQFIEQPLPADQWTQMEKLYQCSALPLFADESCKTIEDVVQCKNRFHGVNIKVMKCGGLVPARRMIKKVRQHGLQVMVGCMAESTVGISAIAHLAPLIDYADMDGQHFIKNDPATGVNVNATGFHFSDLPGIGVTFDHKLLKK